MFSVVNQFLKTVFTGTKVKKKKEKKHTLRQNKMCTDLRRTRRCFLAGRKQGRGATLWTHPAPDSGVEAD